MTRVAAPKISGSVSGKKSGALKSLLNLMGDVARQLEVLLLVLADRHVGGLVDQDVGRHQRRIGVEAERGVLAVLAGLLLELRHAVHPADTGHAVEHPGELGVRRHHRLVEDDLLPAVDAGGQEGRGDLARLAGQQLGILRLGDGVQVDHAIEAFVVVLQAREVADRAEIVAEVEIAGRLHAGQDAALQAAGGVWREMRVGRGVVVTSGMGCGLRSRWKGAGFGPPRTPPVEGEGEAVWRRSRAESRRGD